VQGTGGAIVADNRDKTNQISDELWEQIEPLLPPKSPELESGYPYMGKREAMEAILYMLRAEGKLRDIKAESPLNEYLKEWCRTGVFDRMWQVGILTYNELETLVL
jgi:putative transposase